MQKHRSPSATFRTSSDRPLQGARGIGVEAFFVEEEDAGAEGEERDGEAGGDAEAGGEGRASRKEEERFLGAKFAAMAQRSSLRTSGKEEERFLTCAGRPLRRSEAGRKNRAAPFEMTVGRGAGRAKAEEKVALLRSK